MMRRDRTGWACLAIFLAIWAGAAFASSLNGEAGKRVLIVCDERVQMEALAGFLRDPGQCRVEIVDQESFPATTDAFEAIIDFVHKPFSDRVETALMEYVQGGGRLVSLHHSISSSKRLNKHWLDFCGMTLPTGPREQGGWFVVGNTTVTLVNLRPGHYVTSHKVEYPGTASYRSSEVLRADRILPALPFPRSEVFLGQQITDMRQKEMLFGLKCFDPTASRTIMVDRGGWMQRKGRGWHFYFQVGHATGDFQNPAYGTILLNALTWEEEKEKVKRKK